MTHPDVVVPDVCKGMSQNGKHLILDYSKLICGPDFKRTDTNVVASMTFGGVQHKTSVPWAAVVMICHGGKIMEDWSKESREPPKAASPPVPAGFELEDEDMSKWFSGQVAEG